MILILNIMLKIIKELDNRYFLFVILEKCCYYIFYVASINEILYKLQNLFFVIR